MKLADGSYEALGAAAVTYSTADTAAPVHAGTYTATGTYPGTGDYQPANGTAAVVIGLATPSVTWANPADITYGTALSPTQLNAAASVAGSFAYAPASGAVLDAGSGQTLSTTFTPTDAADYTTATRSVTINVGLEPLTVAAAGGSIYYGQAIPTAAGTLSGVVNGDGITASFANAATAASPAGAYDVTAALADPNHRLSNYSVTNAKGTLTINAAPTAVTVTSSEASSTYGDAVTFTAAVAVTAVNDAAVPTGSVQFYVDGGAFGVPVAVGADGKATSGSVATLTAANHTVTAAYTSADGDFAGSDDKASPLTQAVARADQTITFGPLADKTYGDADFAVTAAGGGSGNPVTFSVVAGAGYASVSGGTVHILGATPTGQVVTVRAAQAGNSNYNDATVVDQPFRIAQASSTTTVTGYSGTYDGNSHGAASDGVTGAGGLTATPALAYYLASDTAHASPLAGAPSDAGSYTVTATYAGDANHTGSSASGAITIAQATPSVAVTDAGGDYRGSAYDATGASVTGVASEGPPAVFGSPALSYT
ncbi:MAG: Ig-like domain-containing protein, partial [Actinobacteria bacterium]|nr:Ig-like domain-containing protein [Actinomycetota bacterium]